MSHNPYSPPRTTVEDDVDALAPMRRPTTVTAAFVFFLIGIAADALILVDALPEYRRALVGGPRIVGMLLGLVFALWLYVMVFRGRNWARIVTLILTCVGFVLWYRQLPTLGLYRYSSLEMALMLARPVCSSIALVLVFGPGREWFRRRAA